MSIIPKSKPQASRAHVIAAAKKQWKMDRPGEPLPAAFMVGIRSYYFRTMGDPNSGDRNIYDDAIGIIGPETYAMFNGNTDPSPFRKGVATLMTGCHPYRFGHHGISRPGGGYPAMRPNTRNEALPVIRDGEAGRSKRDGIAINIHRGGHGTTSSLGCQTLHPRQWDAFYALAKLTFGKKPFWYILIDGPIN